MAAAPLTLPKARKTYTDLRCPECGQRAETLDLSDFKVACPACGETFTAAEAVARLSEKTAEWQRLAEWVGRA